MDFFKKFSPGDLAIGVVLVFFMAVALAIRAIPALFLNDAGYLAIFDTDSYYTLRQVEVMVNQFPHYNWFDPMTAYPGGKTVDWGPLFPFVAAFPCIIFGASTLAEILFWSGWAAPLMAMIMVPVLFSLGRLLWNRSAGLIAAGLIAIISFQYFSISSYGWMDHHIAEVLFSSLFILIYWYALNYTKKNPPGIPNTTAWVLPIALSVSAGICFFLALLASTTVILVLAVVAIYTAVQHIVDFFEKRSTTHILLVNLVFLLVATALLLLFGIRPSYSLTHYSIGIVYVQCALIAETVLFAVLNRGFSGKKWLYLCGLAVLTIGGFILVQTIPVLRAVSNNALLSLVSGTSVYSVGIVETLPWSLTSAWESFNFALVLAAGGFLVLGYTFLQKRESNTVFLLVWSGVMLLVTIKFLRFQYFFTVNAALLAAICIAEALSLRTGKTDQWIAPLISRVFPDQDKSADEPEEKSPEQGVNRKRKKEKPAKSSAVNGRRSYREYILIIVLVITAACVVLSLYQDITYGLDTPDHSLNPDWIASLQWLEKNSPSTGIDYYASYDARGFSYPDEAYGILASTDAGHWITVFSHRIPVTNPFQNNLAGSNGAAAYFLHKNESLANTVLNRFGARYIITDSNTAVDTFTNLVAWPGGSVDISPYIKWFMIPDPADPSHLLKIHRFTEGYYQTQIVRLHLFDGSMTDPGTVFITTYEIRPVPAAGETAGDVKGFARVISQERPVNGSQIFPDIPLVQEGPDLQAQKYMDLFSDRPDEPVGTIPALRHYRLIYESVNNATVTSFPESSPMTLPDKKYVKIFEYVNGARITGDGIIEVPVVTNTGREFIYRQESINSEFVVPYATNGSKYGVAATGPYNIAGTSRYISVTEDDVLAGTKVF